MATNIPYGSPIANKLQSAGLFAANMQRNTTINRLTGKFPQQAQPYEYAESSQRASPSQAVLMATAPSPAAASASRCHCSSGWPRHRH